MHILILGGTGTMSTWMVRELLTMGRRVTVLNRGRSPGLPAGVECLVADRHDPKELAAVLAGRRFDATVDMICFDADQARMLVEALPGCGHLVMCSTVCALGFGWTTFPVPEDAAPAPTEDYGVKKAAAEALLTAHCRKAGIPLTIVRPSTTFDGRGAGILRQIRWDGTAWLGRIRAGKPIVVGDSGFGIHQFMHAEDAGRGFAMIAGNSAAHGRTYHLVGEATTWAEHHRSAMRALGRNVPLIGVPALQLDRAKVPGDGIRHSVFGQHGQFADRRLASEIGFTPRFGLDETIRKVVAELDASGRLVEDADGRWEDELVERWG